MSGESFDNPSTVEKPRSIEMTVNLDDRTEPTTSIVVAIAEATNQSVLDLTPLAETIDPDALDQLFAERASGRSPDLSVTFTYAGSTITVSATGDVWVTPT